MGMNVTEGLEPEAEAPAPAAAEHPSDYAIPGIEAGQPPAETSGTPAQPAPTATPGEVGGTPGTAPAGGEVANVPKYRLDEVIQQRDRANNAIINAHNRLTQLEEDNRKLTTVIARMSQTPLQAGPQAGAVQPRKLSENDQRAVDRVFELMPWLKKAQQLAEKSDDLLRVTNEVVPEMQTNRERYWNGVRGHMYGLLDEHVAKTFLGADKGAKDLNDEQRREYQEGFYSWLQREPSRAERWQQVDQTLITDFIATLEQLYIAPVRRQYGADIQARAKTTSTLPTQPATPAPMATPPPKTNMKDEEAVHNAGWQAMLAQRT